MLGCATGAELGCQREGSELGCDTGDETFAQTKREIVSARLVVPKNRVGKRKRKEQDRWLKLSGLSGMRLDNHQDHQHLNQGI